MKVDLIDYMGTDLTVVNAARVSFDKESLWENAGYDEEVDYVARTLIWHPKLKLSDKDTKLIQYLATHGHWSPFSHPQVTFRIKAPIFVARHLAKHQVGLAWNEVSRRYVDSTPEFYMPDSWRAKAENVKQGSSEEAIADSEGLKKRMEIIYGRMLGNYEGLLMQGVCPEQARMVLPQSMYTEWYWTGSLYAFARVCKQRLDSHAQRETQEVAALINKHMQELFPVSWRALLNDQATD